MNVLAVIWLAASAIGAVVAAMGVADGLRDIHAMIGVPDKNGRWRYALAYVRAQSIRGAIQTAWFLLAIPSVNVNVPLTLPVLVLVATNVALTVAAVWDWWDRRAILADLLKRGVEA